MEGSRRLIVLPTAITMMRKREILITGLKIFTILLQCNNAIVLISVRNRAEIIVKRTPSFTDTENISRAGQAVGRAVEKFGFSAHAADIPAGIPVCAIRSPAVDSPNISPCVRIDQSVFRIEGIHVIITPPPFFPSRMHSRGSRRDPVEFQKDRKPALSCDNSGFGWGACHQLLRRDFASTVDRRCGRHGTLRELMRWYACRIGSEIPSRELERFGNSAIRWRRESK